MIATTTVKTAFHEKTRQKNEERGLTNGEKSDIIMECQKEATSGCGAVGSALPWGGRGRTFKSCHSDQIKPKTVRFRLYFLHFRGKIERFPTTSAPPEIPKIFLTTYLTTVGAKANRLVASVPVRSSQKTKFKRFPEVFPREPFSLFTVYQFFGCSIQRLASY